MASGVLARDGKKERLKPLILLLLCSTPSMPDNPPEQAENSKLPRCAYRKSNSAILMVQSAQDRMADAVALPHQECY
jgi:hypothetical protein